MHKGIGNRRVNVTLNSEVLGKVECFEFRVKITVDGGIETEVKSRINDVGKVLGRKCLVVERWE